MRTLTTSLVLLLAATAGIALYYFFAIPSPEVALSPDTGPVGTRRTFTLKLDARRGALKRVAVTAVQADRKVPLLVKEYPPGSRQATESFTLDRAGLREGAFTLQVDAASFAPRFGAAKKTGRLLPFTLENRPPEVAIVTLAPNITQGGAGLVVYTVSKEVDRSGIVVGDRFFPGYRQGGNRYACLFPFPYDLAADAFRPRLTAVDRVGNEKVINLPVNLKARSYAPDRITLTDPFLAKIATEFGGRFPETKSPFEIFLRANREQRQQDRRQLAVYGQQSSPTPLWDGPFLRMPNSAPLGGFAQLRTYLYQGREVDRQTHLGFDLASLAHAAVPAANRGKVVFAGDFGLYGRGIVIDHGLGLQTLYGHLSQLNVKAGDTVAKGQTLGATGATGMAGGDHLHYEVIVSGQSVNPIEWWDAHWLKDNVTARLQEAVAAGGR